MHRQIEKVVAPHLILAQSMIDCKGHKRKKSDFVIRRPDRRNVPCLIKGDILFDVHTVIKQEGNMPGIGINQEPENENGKA